jgi:ATP/ADP translocase
MWIISLILTGCYVLYAIGTALRLFDNRAGYLSYIGSLNITPGLIVFASLIVMAGSYLTFRRVRQNYREFYIQYLLTDFVVLHSSGSVDEVITPSQRPSGAGEQ